MFYFKASADNEELEFKLPISISIPTKEVKDSMKVFTGITQDVGTINWEQPVLPDTSIPNAFIEMGQQLFKANCASCHAINRKLTGPALKNFQYRGNWKNRKNIYNWIFNPALYAKKDTYAAELIREYNGVLMTGFPQLHSNEINAIIAYINNAEGIESDYPVNESHKQPNVSNCGFDTTFTEIEETYPYYDTTSLPYTFTDSLSDTTNFQNTEYDDFEYELVTKQRYTFEITANGWYNIDQFLKVTDEANIKDVSLVVEIENHPEINLLVQLFIPSEKVLQELNDKKGNGYSFNFGNGKTPLPVGKRGIILVYGSDSEKIYYGVSEFEISEEQVIQIKLKEISEQEFNKLIDQMNIDGIELKSIEKKMELKPKNCNELITINSTTAAAIPEKDAK
jgi:mono/diheme cytochrome c family protein